MLNDKDKNLISERGSNLLLVEQQIKNFKAGFPYLNITRAASVGDGIIKLNNDQIKNLITDYENKSGSKDVVKFVPASGAATRMFKELFAVIDTNDFVGNKAAKKFIDGLEDFAFTAELSAQVGGFDTTESVDIVKGLLLESGLEYGSLPKALLSFHSYENGPRTPLEEHLVEGANYAKSNGGRVKIHFTVSPDHLSKFKDLVTKVLSEYESTFDVKYDISFSTQKSATDTIAVDNANEPFREEDGTILFRPAGHGALLENLNDLDSDIVFIKNIDNVVPDRLKSDTYDYKKALAGLLINAQEEIFAIVNNPIDNPDTVAKQVNEKFFVEMGDDFVSLSNDEKSERIKNRLNRPIRVCGMVLNTGEPGGGPFWVEGTNGSASLQIAETAQIDLDDAKKLAMLKESTHFNPVDLICATKDATGSKFNLLEYRDDNTGFISAKSKNGRDLKAMELPGLWNGAMADWITLFVEVPISTFNPVKTVNDLLKDTHQ